MNEFTPRKARLCFLTLLAISLTAGASENMIDDFELNCRFKNTIDISLNSQHCNYGSDTESDMPEQRL